MDASRRALLAATPGLLALPACQSPPAAPAAAAPAAQAPAWTDQPVFSIARVEVRDGRAFGEYATGHTPTIAAAGGRFLAAGAVPQAVEGSWPPRRVVIHQWANEKAFRDWYQGAAYQPWKARRHQAAATQVVLVQGVAGSAPSPTQAPAFVLIDVEVRDGPAFGRYVQGHMPGMREAGGQFLAAGGRLEVVEGDWTPRRVVIHRWPSAQAFRQWYDSPGYRPWRDIRHGAARTDVALVEGLSEATKAERRMP
ncbi:MAG TPA: DUF1330 domain-containing protein [Ramlibacter sp.]|nr:DUF1330 domain-containing protein [Ramlibacter sp.]